MTPVSGEEWRKLPPEVQAVTPVLTCEGCGRTQAGVSEPPADPSEMTPSEHCGSCAPWICDGCGQECSAAAKCPCWISLDGLPHADIKALLARAGLSVGTPER